MIAIMDFHPRLHIMSAAIHRAARPPRPIEMEEMMVRDNGGEYVACELMANYGAPGGLRVGTSPQ